MLNVMAKFMNKPLFDDWDLDRFDWHGMPEYVSEKQKPFANINVRFRNEEDLMEFAKLIQQPITKKTKSAWYPELDRGGMIRGKSYIDEP